MEKDGGHTMLQTNGLWKSYGISMEILWKIMSGRQSWWKISIVYYLFLRIIRIPFLWNLYGRKFHFYALAYARGA